MVGDEFDGMEVERWKGGFFASGDFEEERRSYADCGIDKKSQGGIGFKIEE
jgi:hypothetical protein